MRTLVTMTISSLLCAALLAQENNRFPAPLGLDRVLTGTVEKAARGRKNPSDKKNAYVLASDGKNYHLHGHEKELSRMTGKRVRITGKTVGEEVTVNNVEPAKD